MVAFNDPNALANQSSHLSLSSPDFLMPVGDAAGDDSEGVISASLP
jgi:hypothetical protein